MYQVFKRHEGKTIGLNLAEPNKLNQVKLERVEETYFCVINPTSGLSCYFPYHWVLSVIDGENGVVYGGTFSKKSVAMVVNIYHHVIYSGATGWGVSF